MASALQLNAFQQNAFQIAVTTDDGDVTLDDVLRIIGRAQRGKNWPRLGTPPDHDVDFREWVTTNPNRRSSG